MIHQGQRRPLGLEPRNDSLAVPAQLADFQRCAVQMVLTRFHAALTVGSQQRNRSALPAASLGNNFIPVASANENSNLLRQLNGRPPRVKLALDR